MAYREVKIDTLQFRDFVPAHERSTVIGEDFVCEDIDRAVEAANQWIRDFQIAVVNVETVTLPAMHRQGGSHKGQFGTGNAEFGRGNPMTWFQLVRVWFTTER